MMSYAGRIDGQMQNLVFWFLSIAGKTTCFQRTNSSQGVKLATIEFRQVGKQYTDGTEAIRGLDLSVADGEFLVFVGPSGCGKSTCLRMLAGLETVTSGQIVIDGTCVNEIAPAHRDVAMVFQNYALYPHMSVKENLAFPLKMRKVPKAIRNEKVREIAHLLALTDFLAHKPGALSGGQRQRVAMGRALVRSPKVFLMDEPLSNLDAKLRTTIRTEIAALQKKLGATLIYVTHDQVEAMTLGDRVAVFDKGSLLQVATPKQLYAQPANVFVASFIGSPGMNIQSATCKGYSEYLELSFYQQSLRLPIKKLNRISLQADKIQPIYFGIRPECLRLSSDKAATFHLEFNVQSIENLGHEKLIYMQVANLGENAGERSANRWVARSAAELEIPVGKTMRAYFEAKDVYLFDQNGVLA